MGRAGYNGQFSWLAWPERTVFFGWWTAFWRLLGGSFRGYGSGESTDPEPRRSIAESPSDKPGRKPSPRYEVWPSLFKVESNFKTPETVDRNDRIGDWPTDSPEKPNSVNCVNAFQ
jgi:hypothetical protein